MSPTRRREPWLALALLLSVSPAAAQRTPITVRGRVTGPDSAPVVGALARLVVAGAPGDSVKTDSAGRYALRAARDSGVVLHVRMLGFTAYQQPVARPTTGGAVTVDVRLARSAVTLSAVRVQEDRTRRPTISDFPAAETGTSSQYVGGNVAPSDAGNLAAMAATIPGVTMTPSADGGMPGFSVLGLGASQNAVTLNGVAFGGAQVPSAAFTSTRLQTTSFDPSVGGFSGGLLTLNLFRGSNWKGGRLVLTYDDPALQFTDAAGARLGQQYRNVQVSASRNGPIVHDKLFYNASVQVGRRASDLTTLANADPSALAAVGVSPDATTSLLTTLNALGVPAVALGAGQTSTKNATALARFDILPTAKRTLNVTVNGSWSETGPSLLGPTALPSHGGETRTLTGGAQLEHQHYIKDRFLSRTRSGFSANALRSTALSTLPDGQVLVGSQLGDGRTGLATLQFGGAAGAARENGAWFWETLHDDSWYVGKKHVVKVAGGLRFDGYTNEPRTNAFGTFTFNSIEELRAGRAASYTRSLGGWRTHGTAASGWASVGDQLRLTDRLSFQYGLRGEANRYGVRPRYNAAVDSLFGARTDEAPATYAVSPRAGVSWSYGHRRNKFGAFQGPVSPRGTIRGGVGLFRGTLAPTLLGAAINGTGLADALQRVTCVGPAAPVPDWDAYASNASSIPTTCANGTMAFVDARSPVTLYLPGYDAPQSWRGQLGWSTTVANRFFISSDATVTRSLYQPSVRDLNFAGVRAFALGDEGGRAVFTDASRIDPATGAVDPLASRVTPRYSRVAGLVSDLHARSEQLNVRLNPSNGVFSTQFWSVSYSVARVRDQLRGFDGAAFGDPRAVAWGTSVGDVRHTIGGNLSWFVPSVASISINAQLRSGTPFTPTVTGDVNGDGSTTNDRAFVFDPATTTDAALASGMRELLATAPSAVRACLTRQLGRAAERNSCRGPWTATMNASFNVQGTALRLPNGSYLTVNVANPLAGIDQLLHDDTRLRGWGQGAFPNPALLVVKGFDPSTGSGQRPTGGRFRYAVNPLFGDARPARSAVRAPMQLTVSFSMPITPPYQNQLLESVIEPGRKWKGTKLTAAQIKQRYITNGFFNPLTAVMAAKDSLLLTKEQLAKLDSINRRYTAQVDTAWGALAAEIAALPTTYDRVALRPRVQSARLKAWDALEVAAITVGKMLTPEQTERLAPEIAQMLDPKQLAVIRRSEIMILY